MKTRGSGKTPSSFRLSLRTIIAAVLVLLAVLFIAQNRNSTRIELFWFSVQAPLWFVLVLIFVVGWVAGFLFERGR
ncbi:LapA family protein [Rhodococcus chondri]|uniref:LapA family protein n=1 Tax=Rhodococcus chondri TaxID=3065941 RepID=A0ABU7JVW7_9NOCA|nr:LapA family protein [Rhodococcus sp. CC-R104]MEE2034161.1 LapA family protein [Rhodococcus sp. CC-R104]